MLASVLGLLKDSFRAYTSDRSTIYAAGLAYYAVFAIAPLLVFVVMFAGLFIDRGLAAGRLAEQIEYLAGPELAGLLSGLAEGVNQRTFTAGGTLFSIVGLLLSAAGIFSQLDAALNDIWGITTLRPQSIRDRLLLFRRKMAPFIVICFLGLLLSSSVLVDAALVTVTNRLALVLPRFAALHPHINRLIIPLLTFATFTVIFKLLPDARSRWRDMAVGGLVTTVLFLVGRLLLNLYLERTGTVSLFGTAGSVVVLLIWVYVSAQILLFGAEFTKLYADRFGQPLVPRRLAAFQDAESAPAKAVEEVLEGSGDAAA